MTPVPVGGQRRLVLTVHYFGSVGFQAKTGLPQRLAQPLDSNLHNALVHAEFYLIAAGIVVRKLQHVGFQTAVMGNDVRYRTEAYHALAKQKFKAQQGFRADCGSCGALNWMYSFGHDITSAKAAANFTSSLKNFSDAESVVTVHNHHFSPRNHPVPQQKLGWVLDILIEFDH